MPKSTANYHVIYDGTCNLCVGFVRQLERLDRGTTFDYIPMQDADTLAQFGITAADCKLGMLLIDADKPDCRWQGSDAAEEIVRQFPAAVPAISNYRLLPGLKWLGDRFYERLRDNRYHWFGRRDRIYRSLYAIGCARDGSASARDRTSAREAEPTSPRLR
ncbi:hypothetical protein KR51_00017170 [Rubidibacter lacunae KORDI 51-2]|uniref:Thiol-disulfide oxidoreductase DCC n=1 Tax=Rubidibacter lacunae KORDI 51-2 TaxID=582515 RepID=U5DM72_9CHRO|nr:DCC1-like thiol-disulfide oxidoreductase family protein [Rubidibacter lacunae]ERN41679.1 hypothetical protein KR51_00017170 [Rubidibacter lacunae KORDI 51-2]